MPGLIRADKNILDAVDPSGNFVEIKTRKDITNLLSRDELKTIVAYAEKILLTTAKRILDGCIDIKPAKLSDTDDACKYCLFSALCNFDRAVNETTTVTKDKREDILKRMAEELQR